MSRPPEQEGREAAGVEADKDAQRHAWERQKHQESLGAINALTDQLAASQESQDAAERKKAFREKLTIGLVMLTVVLTAGGDFIFYRTMKDSRRAARIAHSDNAAALSSAASSAGAALDQAQSESAAALSDAAAANAISQDTAKRQLRAYVFVTPVAIDDFVAGKAPSWGVNASTLGQTPAYHFKLITHVATLKYPKPDFAKAEVEAPKAAEITESVLFPGTPTGNRATITYVPTAAQFDLLKQSTDWRLYVWGRVTYRDTFKAPHFVDFCWSYDATSPDHGYEVCPKRTHAD